MGKKISRNESNNEFCFIIRDLENFQVFNLYYSGNLLFCPVLEKKSDFSRVTGDTTALGRLVIGEMITCSSGVSSSVYTADVTSCISDWVSFFSIEAHI